MYSVVRYTGDGTTVRYPVTFSMGFLRQKFVNCRVGTEVTSGGNPQYRDLVWDGLDSNWVTIQGDAPADGVRIEFRRTVTKDGMLWDFLNASPLSAQALNENSKQLMMALHEIYDGGTDLISNIIANSGVEIETVANIEDVGVTFDASRDMFIFRVRMGEIGLSDALDGTRTASDLIGASEYALGVVNTKVDTFLSSIGGTGVPEVSNVQAGVLPAWGTASLGSLPFALDSRVAWAPVMSGNSGITVRNRSGGGIDLSVNQIHSTTYTDIVADDEVLPTVRSVYALVTGITTPSFSASSDKIGWMGFSGGVGVVWMGANGQDTVKDYTWYFPRAFTATPTYVLNPNAIINATYVDASGGYKDSNYYVGPSGIRLWTTTGSAITRTYNINIIVAGVFA